MGEMYMSDASMAAEFARTAAKDVARKQKSLEAEVALLTHAVILLSRLKLGIGQPDDSQIAQLARLQSVLAQLERI